MPARTLPLTRLLLIAIATALALTATPAVHAHHAPSHRVVVPDAPSAGAATESFSGVVDELVVVDGRTGASVRYHALRLADGRHLALRGGGSTPLAGGVPLTVTGRRSGDHLFVDTLAAPAARELLPRASSTAAATVVEGRLEFLHADDFDRGTCDLLLSVISDDGTHTPLKLATYADILERGMRVRVTGSRLDAGLDLTATRIEILAGPQPEPDIVPAALRSSKILMILIKYSDTATEPYTLAQAQGVMFDASTSVSKYYAESSYGNHLLSGVVTPWLTARFARPATCDYSAMSSEAMYLAGQAGYNTSQYEKFVYVFPSLPGCGWAGLGGGSQAWINQSLNLLVVGHELGHTFGLGHASSVDCGALTIGGACTKSEYGDPAEIMGNQKAAQFNAPHKQDLGYLPAGTVKEHKGGTAAYTIEPLATAGASTYAVKVYANAKRTYWLEYRQPLGVFDASLAAGITNGAYIHLDYPNEYGCDTCVIDMTPATTTFGDAALPTGSQFVDVETGTTITVTARTAAALTVTVATPVRPTFADIPATYWAYADVEALAWNGVTRGCAAGPALFCPNQMVTRAEMAVFIERAKRGSNFAYAATGTVFADVPSTHWAVGPIEQLRTDGITGGCAASPLRYCPDRTITRAEMAIFLLKGRYGGTFNPGTAAGTVFADVPAAHWAAAWIERAYQYGITVGCSASPARYCPDDPVSRAAMAVFLKRGFALVAPPN